jgi:hypothetical protein
VAQSVSVRKCVRADDRVCVRVYEWVRVGTLHVGARALNQFGVVTVCAYVVVCVRVRVRM